MKTSQTLENMRLILARVKYHLEHSDTDIQSIEILLKSYRNMLQLIIDAGGYGAPKNTAEILEEQKEELVLLRRVFVEVVPALLSSDDYTSVEHTVLMSSILTDAIKEIDKHLKDIKRVDIIGESYIRLDEQICKLLKDSGERVLNFHNTTRSTTVETKTTLYNIRIFDESYETTYHTGNCSDTVYIDKNLRPQDIKAIEGYVCVEDKLKIHYF